MLRLSLRYHSLITKFSSWNLFFTKTSVLYRGRHGTGTVSRKIFSPRDRVPEFFSLRDSPAKLSPGIPRPANLSPDPSPRSRISNFSPSPRSRKFGIWVPIPVPYPGFQISAQVPVPDFKMSPSPCPGSRFPGSGLRDPGDPVPGAHPCL